MNGTIGVPTAYYFGQEGLHNILCIDLLGPSMEDMFDLCSRKFSIKTVCMAAKQMVKQSNSGDNNNSRREGGWMEGFEEGSHPPSSLFRFLGFNLFMNAT